MKFLYTTILLFLLLGRASAQDLIYSAGGDKTPGKIVDILPEKIKFKNPDNLTGPDHSRSLAKVLFVFNAAGTYIVIGDKPVDDATKTAFVNETVQPRPFDILVDNKGGVLDMNITKESDTEITGTRHGKPVKAPKSVVVFLIRKNGTHQIFLPAEKAQAFLANAKAKIAQLLAPPSATPAAPVSTPVAANTTPAANTNSGGDLAVDMNLFSKKAVQKTEEFSNYLQAVCSVNTQRELALKSIDLACGLFLNEDSRVEVSSTNSPTKPKYKIRDYLNRLQLRSGQYDKVSIEYANINYASKFTKGTDGNYYAVITFVQKFKGFIDGKVVYGDVTKRNITVVLKSYEKSVDGETQRGWDVFLEDIGVVQTKRV